MYHSNNAFLIISNASLSKNYVSVLREPKVTVQINKIYSTNTIHTKYPVNGINIITNTSYRQY